jgi:hypothetical protein
MRAVLLPVVLMLLVAGGSTTAGEFAVEQTDDGVTVKLDGQLFTRYVKQSGSKPILYPIIGPTGKPMTRSFPMERVKGERADHPHHRSFWFTHGDVNGIDFWSEGRGKGRTVHREYRKVEGGQRGVVAVVVDWIGPDDKKMLEDERSYTFSTDGESRLIDFDITLKAGDAAVKFGDTKEGSFGLRIPTSMDVTSRRGGHIITSEGLRDRDAWGKPAAWVDYHGPVDGQEVGIAILNHPSSFRFPTRWHVRDYGLFAANPFGLADFPKVEGSGGAYTLEPGQSLTLKYRVILHKGSDQPGQVGQWFSQYTGK